jgi:hypothetical protein
MTMKSIRKDLFVCLSQHGEQTMDEIVTRLPCYSRSRISNNINAARIEELILRDKDVVTGQPAYKLTPAGKKRLEAILAKVADPEAAPAAQQGADIDVPVIRKPKVSEEVQDNVAAVLRAQLKNAEQQRDAHFASAETAMKRVDELVEETRSLKQMLESVGESASIDMKRIADLEDDVRRQTQRAVAAEANRDDLKKMLDEVAESTAADMRLIEELRSQIDTKDRIIESLTDEAMNTKDIKDAAVAYLIRTPGRPHKVRIKLEGAHAAALASARTHVRAYVFAMVPVGKAVRGAEWKESA